MNKNTPMPTPLPSWQHIFIFPAASFVVCVCLWAYALTSYSLFAAFSPVLLYVSLLALFHLLISFLCHYIHCLSSSPSACLIHFVSSVHSLDARSLHPTLSLPLSECWFCSPALIEPMPVWLYCVESLMTLSHAPVCGCVCCARTCT